MSNACNVYISYVICNACIRNIPNTEEGKEGTLLIKWHNFRENSGKKLKKVKLR